MCVFAEMCCAHLCISRHITVVVSSDGKSRFCLKAKAGDNLCFLDANKSHEKTKTNPVFVSLSVLSDFPILFLAVLSLH